MVERLTPSRRLFLVVNTLGLLLISFICIAPLWHVFMASISDPAMVEVYNGIILRPLGTASFKAYTRVFQNPNIIIGYTNTLFYVAAGTLISVILSTLGGYVMASKRFRFRKQMTFFITFTMMLKPWWCISL